MSNCDGRLQTFNMEILNILVSFGCIISHTSQSHLCCPNALTQLQCSILLYSIRRRTHSHAGGHDPQVCPVPGDGASPRSGTTKWRSLAGDLFILETPFPS